MLNLQHSLQRAAFGLEDDGTLKARAERRERIMSGPVVISVDGVDKRFRIPDGGGPSHSDRLSRPHRRVRYRELRALRGVSFDVHRGEFFGIVGRNGSGKSTLLKILASIYRADSGRIRMAGRLAPFIELGVGFNSELTARENVALNGVMMGLGRREAARRLDAVLEFAELEQFTDLKLKNYSSGMLVRLAFAVMVQADADVMLVDEVLAVGDAAFAQKCTDVFREKKAAGKTLVLVTHDMAAVQAFCDRAMLIHDGEQRYLGDPEEATMRYYRLNFTGRREAGGSDPDVEVLDAWLSDRAGTRVTDAEQSRPFTFNVVLGIRRALPAPAVGFELLNVDGVSVLGFGTNLDDDRGDPQSLDPGTRVTLSTDVDTRLVPGRYSVVCSVARTRSSRDDALRDLRVLDFLVKGTEPIPGMVEVAADVRVEVQRGS